MDFFAVRTKINKKKNRQFILLCLGLATNQVKARQDVTITQFFVFRVIIMNIFLLLSGGMVSAAHVAANTLSYSTSDFLTQK
jgi:hypothetical protein